MQFLIQIFLILFIWYVAAFLSIKIWRMDIDVKEFINPVRWFHSSIESKTSWIPQREKDAIYQEGKIVGHVIGSLIDVPEKSCFFYTIKNADNFDETKITEYQKYKLQYIKAEIKSDIQFAGISSGITYKNISFTIIGPRDF